MNTLQPAPREPLRVWPGVTAVVVLWLAMIGLPAILPQLAGVGLIVAAACALLVIVWWLFFSRTPWLERLGALALIVAAVWLTKRVVHPSVQNGAQGYLIVAAAIPVLSLALVAAAAIGRRRSGGTRRAVIAAGILLGCGFLTLLRTDGMRGEGGADVRWRWTPTAEQQLLATARDEPLDFARDRPSPAAPAATAPAAAPAAASRESGLKISPPNVPPAPEPPAIWPGFRGPSRDSIIRGVRIETDWSKAPPVELWRRPIGPGWSSFAVRADVLYTQEQRGDDEIVGAYKVTTGEPVWRHRDAARFWESNGGAGPRATPTLHNGRVYALGATGILNVLNADTGAVIWSRNAQADTDAPQPGWGFAGSPLLLDDSVVVATSGRLASYDLTTGKLRWSRKTAGGGYGSPQLVTIGGVPQILLPSGGGITSVTPGDGTTLWDHRWPPTGTSIVQPAVTENGDLLIGAIDGMALPMGLRRLTAKRGSSGWTVEERWTSTGLKPNFNDYVIHKGYAFGFDGSILSCIDVESGTRKWKGGRYGYGQLVLLPDQDVLLVLSEEGELALVSATPDKHTELAKAPAISGKTWNHPVLAGDTLLVRNGEEMAAFRLSIAGR